MADVKTITVAEELYNNKDEVARNKISAIENFTNTDFCAALVDFMFPIGSIFISFNDSAPFDYGTWVKIGQGRTLVGVDTSNTDEALHTVGNYIGQADAVLPSHTHTQASHTHTVNSHTHGPGSLKGYYRMRNKDDGTTNVNGAVAYGYSAFDRVSGADAVVINSGVTGATAPGTNSQTPVINSVGVDATNKNYQPSLTTYFWQRVADSVES